MRLDAGGIKISNPKIIAKSLAEKGPTDVNTVIAPYVISADLTARKDHEPTVDGKQYVRDVGSLRCFSDTTHPSI